MWLLALPLRLLVWLYQRLISPALPPACRYYPSCSRYAAEALAVHGAFTGTWLAARRLLRCHPWCEGGIDPVPPRSSARARQQLAHPRH
jgi:putative membrane protein insertion efficiency factor